MTRTLALAIILAIALGVIVVALLGPNTVNLSGCYSGWPACP